MWELRIICMLFGSHVCKWPEWKLQSLNGINDNMTRRLFCQDYQYSNSNRACVPMSHPTSNEGSILFRSHLNITDSNRHSVYEEIKLHLQNSAAFVRFLKDVNKSIDQNTPFNIDVVRMVMACHDGQSIFMSIMSDPSTSEESNYNRLILIAALSRMKKYTVYYDNYCL